MRIETEQFVLRNWREDDAERLAEIANNKKIYDNLRDRFPHPYTIEDAQRFIENAQEEGTQAILAAIEIGGRLMGSIGAFIQDDIYRYNTEIGYFLAEECWGHGVMTRNSMKR